METKAQIISTDAAVAESPTQQELRKKAPHRSLATRIALGLVGLVLFAAMGYLLGQFIVDLNIQRPWWFPR
ncbi:MAG: hypothetical protein ABSG31_01600 [Tepidisphaeraceae bacterium]